MSLRPLALAALLTAGTVSAGEPARPRLDRFGDPLPAGALVRLGSLRLRPESPADGCVFAPDGKTLFSSSFGRCGEGNYPRGKQSVLHAWDPATGKRLRRLELPGVAEGCCFTLSADGKSLVVGCDDGVVRWLDAVTGAERWVVAIAGRRIADLALSTDGKTLLTQSHEGKVAVYDTADGKQRWVIEGERWFPRPVLLPDGKHLVMARPDRTVYLVDAGTGKDVRVFERGGRDREPPIHLYGLAVSPDGKWLAYAWDYQVTVCSVETGKVVSHFDKGWAQALTFAPGGRFLAMGLPPGARVFGIPSGAELRLLDAGAKHAGRRLAYAPDGKTLAGIGADGSVHLWDVAAGREIHPTVGHTHDVQGLVFLGDGQQLVSFDRQGRLLAWDAATGQTIESEPGRFSGEPWTRTADGKHHLFISRGSQFRPGSHVLTRSADGKGVQWFDSLHYLNLWRPTLGEEELHVEVPEDADSQLGAVSPDGKRVVLVGGRDGRLRLLDLSVAGDKGRVLAMPPDAQVGRLDLAPEGQHYRTTRKGLVFTPDGRRLIATASDGAVRVWNAATAKEVRTLIASEGNARLRPPAKVLVSPDGRSLLLVDSDKGMHVWEVAGGRVRMRLPNLEDGRDCVAWSPDGRLVALGHADGRVQVLAAPAGREAAKWTTQQGSVESLAFSPDGRLLASGGADGTILLWQMPAMPAAVVTLSETQRTALWADLGDADAGRAYRALLVLVDNPEPAISIIQDRLKMLPAPPEARRLEILIAGLDSDAFAEREKASRELAELGAAAESALRRALVKTANAEVRRRATVLLERIARNEIAPERLRALRAVEVLERIGTPAARRLLADLARRINDPLLEQEIADSLDRLGGRR